MNDHYRELLRQYLIQINDLGKYPLCQTKILEKRLWEAVNDERSSESSEPLHQRAG